MRSSRRSEGGAALSEQDHLEQIEAQFLDAPTAEGLISLYRALIEAGVDDRLAAILDKVRPIQHRVTLVQADSDPITLEALSRDPHVHVRRVVASHPRITEECAFRLSEDQQPPVRLALRKNPKTHAFLAAAITIEDSPGERSDELVAADHLLEAAWQARRAGMTGDELTQLAEEWLGVDREGIVNLTREQMGLLLQVLNAKLGRGTMPRKPKIERKTPPKGKKKQ